MRRKADLEFDQQYGVDTAGVFRPRSDQVVGRNWALGGNYQAVHPAAFLEAMQTVNVAHKDFVFIDLGAGKGRTLLMAAAFPFKRIIGVEYCDELSQVARLNASRLPAWAKKCDTIEVVTADAAEYVFPDDPLVIFMNHPFAEPVMAKVVENVRDSLDRKSRHIIVAYLFPYFGSLWETTVFTKRSGTNLAVFDSQPSEPKNSPNSEGTFTE
ncbi:MAG TPA: class I SAM-dependent methyltransferase [Clostridia bacterium]|nr:class I SAM-dependent methyltransferase [Clostridia bacterium]